MIEHIITYVFPPAFGLLPGVMNTPSARAMLLAIGLQESEFEQRIQMGGGPARGFWQFERGGGVSGVIAHHSTSLYLTQACDELRLAPTAERLYEAMAFNDTIACVMARLLLWTLPGILAGHGEIERGWGQYVEAWRPGNPRHADWAGNFSKAWELVR